MGTGLVSEHVVVNYSIWVIASLLAVNFNMVSLLL